MKQASVEAVVIGATVGRASTVCIPMEGGQPTGRSCRVATVGMAWEAHDRVMHAKTEEWGTVDTSMAIRGVEASWSKTYMQEVRGTLRGCATDLPLAQAIERGVLRIHVLHCLVPL